MRRQASFLSPGKFQGHCKMFLKVLRCVLPKLLLLILSISDRLIKDMLKISQYQDDTEASLYGDFRRRITYVKFVPCIMHCVLLFE